MAMFHESRNIVFFGSFGVVGFVFCFFCFGFFVFLVLVFLVFPELASEDFEMDFPWVVLDSFH